MVLYAAFMLVAGIGIPVMAALNSRLGSELGNPALATTILFMVGFIVSVNRRCALCMVRARRHVDKNIKTVETLVDENGAF